MTAENHPDLEETPDIQIQEARGVPNKIPKRPRLRHAIKLLKVTGKDRVLKAA